MICCFSVSRVCWSTKRHLKTSAGGGWNSLARVTSEIWDCTAGGCQASNMNSPNNRKYFESTDWKVCHVKHKDSFYWEDVIWLFTSCRQQKTQETEAIWSDGIDKLNSRVQTFCQPAWTQSSNYNQTLNLILVTNLQFVWTNTPNSI